MLMASWKNYDKRTFRLSGIHPDQVRTGFPLKTLLADPARQPQHEDQHFGDRLVEIRRNFVADLDMG
jgi:hypothetical protein